jgi:hypothetical protein
MSGRQVQLVRVGTEPALQLVSQDARIGFGHILQKELVHPNSGTGGSSFQRFDELWSHLTLVSG